MTTPQLEAVTRRDHTRRVHLAAVAVLVAVIVAMTGWGVATSSAPAVTKAPAWTTTLLGTLQPADRQLLVDAEDYLGSPTSGRATLWAAQQVLIKDCMRGAGDEYITVAYAPTAVDVAGGFAP